MSPTTPLSRARPGADQTKLPKVERSLGSGTSERSQSPEQGRDTRELMTRQVWGARVLQSGRRHPDCEANDRWTFTVFAGEPLTDGAAQSGTVLKSKVRYRLGKPGRGIGSARVAPGIVIT